MIKRFFRNIPTAYSVLAASFVAALLVAQAPVISRALADDSGTPAAPAADDNRGGNSGLPIPRMVSLGAQEINMRSGPGTRYPIKWVYTRKGLPVQVEAEFDIWRKIRDRDGETGWVHGSMLSGRRTVEILSRSETDNVVLLHDRASEQSKPVLRAENHVIAELMECEKDWCRLRIDGKKGWARREKLWGLMPGDG